MKYKVRFTIVWLRLEGLPEAAARNGDVLVVKWKKSARRHGRTPKTQLQDDRAAWPVDAFCHVTTWLKWPVGGHPFESNVVRVRVFRVPADHTTSRFKRILAHLHLRKRPKKVLEGHIPLNELYHDATERVVPIVLGNVDGGQSLNQTQQRLPSMPAWRIAASSSMFRGLGIESRPVLWIAVTANTLRFA